MTPQLPAVTPREAMRALEGADGSSIELGEATTSFRHPNHLHRVVVPMHARDLAKGTLNAIIEASGVSREEFLRLL